mgnify:CR=1 FL=1
MTRLNETLTTYQRNDPAARSKLEIFLLYNGLHAQIYYRVAHWLYGHKCLFLARWVSQRAKRRTGVEIHPAAKIGRRLVIDHGTGIVIGATAEIGDDCLLYQGVTPGGTGAAREKRHPTLGNNVMVGCGAKVLGAFRVGDNVKIAANSVVLREVPDNCTVVGIPGKVVAKDGQSLKHDAELKAKHQADLEHDKLPDPVEDALDCMQKKIKELEAKIKFWEEKQNEQTNHGA